MDWILDKKRPICPQLVERLCIMIASGEAGAGEKLLSVRDVALRAGVTPNTVQKSFEQLEQKGIIYSKRGSGWYVSEDTHIAQEILNGLVSDKTAAYIGDMRNLGLGNEQILNAVKGEFTNE